MHLDSNGVSAEGKANLSILEAQEAEEEAAIARLEAEEERLAQSGGAEMDFLYRLREKLRQPILYAHRKAYYYRPPEKELKEFKRIVLLEGEALCNYLVEGIDTGVPGRKLASYVSKRDYYILPGIGAISLATGRYFKGGKKEGYQKGLGDPIELWRNFKGTGFDEALFGLTDWLIQLREKKARHLEDVLGISTNELKQLFWQAFEDKGLIAGPKVLFYRTRKGAKDRTAWTTERALWKILLEVYGELCTQSHYTASPHGLRGLLEIWLRTDTRFKVLRRWRPKGVPLAEARVIEYAFLPTTVPLSLPPRPEQSPPGNASPRKSVTEKTL
jgi:hypothetical protein